MLPAQQIHSITFVALLLVLSQQCQACYPVTEVSGLEPAQCESARQGDDHAYPEAAGVADNRLYTAVADYLLRLSASEYVGTFAYSIA